MEKIIFDRRGFSIVEAIFASAILIFILGALVILYVNFSKFYSRQQTELNMGGSAREAMKELQNGALQADQILTSNTFSGTTYSTDQDTLVLQIPSADGSGNIVSGKHDYVVFYLAGNSLYGLVEADAASYRSSGLNQISDSVETLIFTYDNADLSQATKINMNIQMQKVSGGLTISYNLQQEIYLRNI